MFNQKEYESQVALLLQCLPSVASESAFAIKGGTAINLFIRDLPRLSVDIDLIYLPISDRSQSLLGIEEGLRRIKEKLEERDPTLKIMPQMNQATKTIVKLHILKQETRIIIEPNLILRGSVYPSQKMNVVPAVEKRFKVSVSDVLIASISDVYAGKICAALDRQHPRDLFDVKLLLEEGISTEIKKVFLVYLASNSRPMSELLDPYLLDQRKVYQEEFIGMSNSMVSYEPLLEAREALIVTIHKALNDQDKEFLLSIKRGMPNWDKIDLTHIAQLPGIKWKLLNISRMDPIKHRLALEKLEKVLA